MWKLAVLMAPCAIFAGTHAGAVKASADGDKCSLSWNGDEKVELSFSRAAGLLRSPVTVQVDNRKITFNGFYVVFNGKQEGYVSRSVKTMVEKDSIRVVHLLDHPDSPSPIRVEFTVSLSLDNKAMHFRVDTANGEKLHLDRLGIGKHQGNGLDPTRMSFGKMFIMDGPIAPFKVDYTYNSARFWYFTMANGLTEMIASDSVPRSFDFDPASGTYDMPTYCDSPITYTFVITGKGAQEAIAQYRASLDLPGPATLSQLPGRVTLQTAHPIRERYEDFLDELTGRGVRDFIWLAYVPAAGDRTVVEPFGALYSIYDMYTDLFDTGLRKAQGWTPEWVRYDQPGHIERGYWNASRLLPNLYVEMAKTRVQGTLGAKFENHGFVNTPATRYSNLAITKREVHPSALYLDVHASKIPRHYWDYWGKHHSEAEHMQHERELFEFARQYLGGVPVFSEVDGEAFAGIMDAGIFHPWPPLEKLGIRCRAWQYYPSIELVHRGRLLNSGAGAPYSLPNHNIQGMATAIQFGRPQVISAYWGTPQNDVGGRAELYYLSSAFHKMLGLSRMERVDFDGDSLDRQIASYSNGARIRTNLGVADWDVNGFVLPQWGYLIEGPGDFLQYRARKGEQIGEVVNGKDYQYFASEKSYDFGPVVINGAVAVRSAPNGRITFHELEKPRGEVHFRLGRLSGTKSGQKAVRAWALMTRGRRLELKFPDFRQEADLVRFRPAEMATTVGYEIELSKP